MKKNILSAVFIFFSLLMVMKLNAQQVEISLTSSAFKKCNKLVFGSNVAWPRNGEGLFDPARDTVPDSIFKLIKDLGITSLRYPGGGLAEKFDWKSSIGKMDQRGFSLEYSNHKKKVLFGLDDFLKLCEKLNVKPVITVGFSNYTDEDILNLLEYCNGSSTTQYGKTRAENGHTKPYNVKYWEIGNENYWQGTSPEQTSHYANRTLAIEKEMKKYDPSILVGAVLSNKDFSWDTTVIKTCAQESDFLIIHYYLPGIKFISQDNFEKAYVASTRWMKDNLLKLKNYANQYNKNIKFAVTEYNYRAFNPNGKFENKKKGDIYQALQIAEFIRIFLNGDVLLANKFNLSANDLHNFADINFNNGDSLSLVPSYFVQKAIYRSDIDSLVEINVTSPDVSISNYWKINHIIAPIVTAFAGINKEKNKITLFIINRGLKGYNNAQLNLSGFNIDNDANYTLIHSKNDSNLNDVEVSFGKETLVINNSSINLEIPALSFTKYELSLK